MWESLVFGAEKCSHESELHGRDGFARGKQIRRIADVGTSYKQNNAAVFGGAGEEKEKVKKSRNGYRCLEQRPRPKDFFPQTS